MLTHRSFHAQSDEGGFCVGGSCKRHHLCNTVPSNQWWLTVAGHRLVALGTITLTSTLVFVATFQALQSNNKSFKLVSRKNFGPGN